MLIEYFKTKYYIKNMKRKFLIVLLMVCCTCLFAASSQKVYFMTDDVWQMADKLCRLNGVLGPTPVSPTTEAEIKVALNRLNYDSLSSYSKKLYDQILEKFDEKSGWSYEDNEVIIDPSIKINPQLYIFNNRKSTYADEFYKQYKDRDQFIITDLETSIHDRVYFYFQYAVMDTPIGFQLDANGKQGVGNLYQSYSNFSTFFNIALNGEFIGSLIGNKDNANNSVFSHVPMKAGLSIGNNYMNFVIGRFKQAFGNGVTGNLIIGDNFSYQELMKLSFFTNVFTYHLSLTHYDNAETNTRFMFEGPHQNRSIQRFDFSFYDKFRFAVNIGAHIYSPTMFDWRMVMSMMIVHNWNNNSEDITLAKGDEINNILGFEFEWVINKTFTLTSQVAIDQFQLPVEKGSVVPSANGFILNLKMLNPTKKGIFESYIEGVYTNPYLYLNYKENTGGSPNYCLDHIAGYYWWQCGKGELNYLGHSFGPDTIALAVGTSFTSFDNWKLSGDILFKIHGEKGIEKTYWPKQSQTNRDVNNQNKYSTPTGTPEYTLQVDIAGEYKLTSSISFNVSLMNRWQWNYHNNLGERKYSAQGSFGIKWSII